MAFDLRPCGLDVVRHLVVAHHGYGSVGANATYAFAVYENEVPVAAYVWQPPPVGAARSVCPEVPGGVLALSRMVAVDKQDRRLKHISKPLRAQMKCHIDRGRWPVLLTYSDEGEGHTGYVYQCSGWEKTVRARRPVYENADGLRASRYANGKYAGRDLVRREDTFVQRWEHWACPRGQALTWMEQHGWRRVPRPGRVWKSGNPAFTWVQTIDTTA